MGNTILVRELGRNLLPGEVGLKLLSMLTRTMVGDMALRPTGGNQVGQGIPREQWQSSANFQLIVYDTIIMTQCLLVANKASMSIASRLCNRSSMACILIAKLSLGIGAEMKLLYALSPGPARGRIAWMKIITRLNLPIVSVMFLALMIGL